MVSLGFDFLRLETVDTATPNAMAKMTIAAKFASFKDSKIL